MKDYYSILKITTNSTESDIRKAYRRLAKQYHPVVDVLNLFPENKILGGAFQGNLGVFITNNLAFGINPYFAKVKNTYVSDYNLHNERQDLQLFGLNTYLRYYFINKEKYKIFASTSGGFGNFDKKPKDLAAAINTLSSNKSIATFLAGIGLNYFLSDKLSLELNVPIIFLKYVSLDAYDANFQTLAPTIGIQYYWK